MRIGLTVATVGLLGGVGAVTAEPELVFSASDVPTLRERVKSGEHPVIWAEVLARANDYCTPGSRRYADPAQIDAPVEGARIQVLAHHFGRRLSEWGQALGFAYLITGEERFGVHGAKILATAAERLPASDPRVAKSFAGARGDIMRGFAVGLDWLGGTLSNEQRQQVEDTGAEYIRVILKEAKHEKTWWVPSHNFMGVSLGAAGCLSLKLRERFPDEAAAWTRDCAGLVTRWLDEGFDEQGAYFEGTGYAHYGLTNAVLFAHALGRTGGPDLFDHARLRRVPHFFAMSLLPGSREFDARNDANYAGLGDPFMSRLAEAYGDGLAKWLWERCASGFSPLRIVWDNDVEAVEPTPDSPGLAEHFVGRGLCVFRTGWRKGEVMFSIESGPFYPITHNQADKGHFTLYGLGGRWAIDSGYGNNREPGGRDQTVAHNCVLIDGEGQALSGAGAGTNGKVVAYDNNARYGYALCDATEAYNRNSKGQPGATARQARRHAVFIRPSGAVPAYAVVLDDIRKDDEPHDYTWLLHTDATNTVDIRDDGVVIRPQGTSGGACVGTPPGAEGQGSCEWRFTLDEAMDAVVWARVRAVGEEAGKSDSFIVEVDTGEPISWHMPGARQWTWGKVSSGIQHEGGTFPLSSGEHVLRFKTREPGAQVDRLAVTDASAPGPPFTEGSRVVLLEAESGKLVSPMCVVREEGEALPARMRLFMHAAAPVAYRVDAYDGHPRLNASTKALSPEFAAVLLPLPGDVEAPAVEFSRLGETLRVRVSWAGRVDDVLWPASGDRRPTVELRDGE